MREFEPHSGYGEISRVTARQAKKLYRQMVIPFALTIAISAVILIWAIYYLQSHFTEYSTLSAKQSLDIRLERQLIALSDMAQLNARNKILVQALENNASEYSLVTPFDIINQNERRLDIGFIALNERETQLVQANAFIQPNTGAQLQEAFERIVQYARSKFLGNGVSFSGWTIFDEKIMGCGVAPVGPSNATHWSFFDASKGPYLGFCISLDDDYLSQISQDVPDGSLYQTSLNSLSSTGTPVLDFEGRPIAVLDWERNGSSKNLAAPLAISGVIFTAILLICFFLFSQRLQALIAAIARRERSLLEQQRSIHQLIKDPKISNAQASSFIQLITEKAAKILKVGRVGIWRIELLAEQATAMDIYVKEKNAHGSAGLTLDCADYPGITSALRSEDIILISDMNQDRRAVDFKKTIERYQIKAAIYTYVELSDDVAILLSCEDTHSTRSWTIEEQIYVQSLVNLAAMSTAISNQKDLAISLQGAKEEAEAASQAKSSFLARMSHEIRTPLNGILGMAHLMLSTTQDEDSKQHLRVLLSSSESLLNLLNDILDLSKLEAGRFDIISSKFSLKEFCEEVQLFWASSFEKKNIAFSVTCRGNKQATIKADRHRLRQILFNLINNASKFTESGQVLVEFSLTDDGQHILNCTVKDTGIGIEKERQATIFNEFSQSQGGSKHQIDGTGLGLSICKSLVEHMGGKISMQSEFGAGSCFSFFVPCEYETLQSSPLSTEILEPTNTPDMETNVVEPKKAQSDGLCILIVEDLEINRKVIALMVESLGHRHKFACDGVDAVEQLRSHDFDLVLMDIQMPRMDGVTATKEIRKLGNNAAKTPIIAVTANAMAGDKEEYLAAGMNGYLSKPISPEGLSNEIEALGLLKGGQDNRSVA